MSETFVIEFRHRIMASDKASVFICRFESVQAPDQGDLVNLNGHPYRVVERCWAYYDDCKEHYCYVDVIPASPLPEPLRGE